MGRSKTSPFSLPPPMPVAATPTRTDVDGREAVGFQVNEPSAVPDGGGGLRSRSLGRWHTVIGVGFDPQRVEWHLSDTGAVEADVEVPVGVVAVVRLPGRGEELLDGESVGSPHERQSSRAEPAGGGVRGANLRTGVRRPVPDRWRCARRARARTPRGGAHGRCLRRDHVLQQAGAPGPRVRSGQSADACSSRSFVVVRLGQRPARVLTAFFERARRDLRTSRLADRGSVELEPSGQLGPRRDAELGEDSVQV